MLRRLALTTVLAATALPAGWTSPASAGIGPDYVSSDNLELVNRLKTTGDGVGARIVGDYLYVTSTKSLEIYEIASNPENPPLVNLTSLDVEFENEEVPTNGKLLGISGDTGCDPKALTDNPTAPPDILGMTNCLSLWDVTNKAAPVYIRSVLNAGDHTATCVLDCTYFYGSSGTIVDAHDPKTATIIGNWREGIGEEAANSCHHVREIQPGIILASCQPTLLFSIRAEDGGSILKPVLIATATNEDQRFVHSSRWPREGRDKFMFSGGETNASPQCDDTVGAFMLWDASGVRDGNGGFVKGGKFTLLDEIRPSNGQYIDGRSPYNGLGCSVHWFTNHPEFRNGGAVALAQYENGTRLLQITPQGKIVEQGFFLPLGGSTSAPHFHPNGKVIYAIDYSRGVDVLRYTGPSYAPTDSGDVVPSPGTTAGTNGASADGSCAGSAGFKTVGASAAGSGLRFDVTPGQPGTFDVEVFQQSAGRRLLGSRLKASFKGRSDSFVWNGRDSRGKRVGSGVYVVRYTAKLADGTRDVRRIAVVLRGSRFAQAKGFAQQTNCGIFSNLTLSGPVFGGKRKAPLGITYTLARSATNVRLDVYSGSKRVKTLAGGGAPGHAYRYRIAAKGIKPGKLITVRVTALQNGSPVAATQLFSVRL